MMFSPLLSLFTLAPSLRRAGSRALTIYVPVRAEGYDARWYDIEFGDLLQRYRERLGENDAEVMKNELRRLRAHLATVRTAGCPALAGFADEDAGVLELIKLRAMAPERLEVGDVLLAPALRQLEQFPPALVAVVDKERLMTFGVILGEIFPIEHVAGVPVRHTRAGWTSAASNQRRADNRARFNLERVEATIEREMASGAYACLYLAGPDEARSELEHLLPESMTPHLAGHLSISLDSSTIEHDVRRQLGI